MKIYLAVLAVLLTLGLIGGIVFAIASHHPWQPNSQTCAAQNLSASQLSACFTWQTNDIGGN